MRLEHALLLAICFTLCSCQRPNQLQIPSSASRYATAQKLEHLELLGRIPSLEGFDRSAPGWTFCDRGVCALGGKPIGGDAEALDGGDRLITWAVAPGRDTSQALARWRELSGPSLPRQHSSSSMVQGRIDVDMLLERLKFENPRARELLERASNQLARVEFEADLVEDDLRATLRVVPRPGEPRFVTGLGTAAGDMPDLGPLVDAGAAGIVRVSADPNAIWALLRSAASARDRAALDDFLDALREEFNIDLEEDLLAHLTGHFAVVAYDVDAERPVIDWLTGAATREALVVGITDAEPIRRLLGAATQLSRGKLNTQRADGERTQWAWIDDEGELRWTLLLGPEQIVIVDSVTAFERAQRLEDAPAPLHSGLGERGVSELLAGQKRSGLYLNAAALRALPGTGWWDDYRWVTLVADESGPDEVIELRIGGFKDH